MSCIGLSRDIRIVVSSRVLSAKIKDSDELLLRWFEKYFVKIWNLVCNYVKLCGVMHCEVL